MSTLLRRWSSTLDYLNDTESALETNGGRPQTSLISKNLDEIVDLIRKPAFKLTDMRAVFDAVKNMNGVGIDDRELLLENLIVLMSRLQPQFPDVSLKIQKFVIGILYKDLPHPPSGYLDIVPLTVNRPEIKFDETDRIKFGEADRIKYAFRSADGSYNNPLIPSLGKAGSPYARSVPSSNISPRSALPDAGLVFDTLLKREKFVEHPGGISSLFFAFADLVIHSIFNTNHDDPTINDASSYLDLSVLYGSNEDQVKSIRKHDGTGMLKPDTFADARLLMMPPAACALLILLNRNHNFVAQRLLAINENGNFVTNPSDTQKNRQDDEIFHRARLVNCGYFMKIILGDYVGAILGLVRDESSWRLDPLMNIREVGHEFVPVGEGNVVSIEFNLMYRWHATLSQKDTTWIEGFFKGVPQFRGKKAEDISIHDFKQASDQMKKDKKDKKGGPEEWTFGSLKRENGRFKDEDLAKVLHDATEARAGAFGARGIPECLRVIEMMGIEQSRSWGTCSLNEFRKFLGLKPYKDFEEWNPKPEIHTAAAALYRDIDNLELHVGLQAEETKKPGPGAGLCPGYTISRAILADAVCLTRGDRFMTTEFTPYNLTAWGYQDCQYDDKDGSYGGLLTKLLFRTLPDFYPKGSAYAHFPFLEPKYMEEKMTRDDPNVVSKYTFTRPKPLTATVSVDDFASVKKILDSPSSYISAYDNRLLTAVEQKLGSSTDSLKSSTSKRDEKKKRRSSLFWSTNGKKAAKLRVDDVTKDEESRIREEEYQVSGLEASKKKLTSGVAALNDLIFTKPEKGTAAYFAQKTKSLIELHSFTKVGSDQKCVDIVKDVINFLPVHWISHVLGLPLKAVGSTNGAWREKLLYDEFADISRYVYLNFEPVDDWKLREATQANAKKIIDIVEDHIDGIHSILSVSDRINHLGLTDNYSHGFLRNLWQAAGKECSPAQFAAQVFAAVIPTSALYSLSLAHIVNFYLDEDKKAARDKIVELAKSEDKNASAEIMKYVSEALRLDPAIPGVYRTAAQDDVLGSVEIKAGDNVFASIVNANQDASANAFGPDPSIADYGHTARKPGITAFGANGLLTPDFLQTTLPPALGTILGLKGLVRGPGKSGQFIRFVEKFHETNVTRYIDLQGFVTPWADSLIVQYSK